MLDKYSAAKCTTTEQAVIKLIAAAFGGEKLNKNDFAGTDWYAVFAELKAQAAAAIPMDVLPEVEELIPRELFNEWLMYSVQVMSFGERILDAQSELIELFCNNNISICILKGMTAACNYPKPLYRNMGDIDFLVDKKDYERAYQIMNENGYTICFDEDILGQDSIDGNRAVLSEEYIVGAGEDIFAQHIGFRKNGILFEMHHRPSGLDVRGEKGKELRVLFDNICSQHEKVEFDGHVFFRLPRLQHGLVLLMHIVHHIESGLGIRQICDWMMFVDNELTDTVWGSEFQPVLKRAGLEQLACTVTKMCKIYFNLNNVTWCDGVDEELCSELMRFVLNNGNFGRKDISTSRTKIVLGDTDSDKKYPFIISIIVNLQKSGVKTWSLVERFPILKCVAWAYMPVRYVGRILTGKRSIKYTAHLADTVRKNKSLQDKLAIYK